MQEPQEKTQVQSLGWEDPLEKEMATYSSILARRIPWTEEPGEPDWALWSMGLQRIGHNWAAKQQCIHSMIDWGLDLNHCPGKSSLPRPQASQTVWWPWLVFSFPYVQSILWSDKKKNPVYEKWPSSRRKLNNSWKAVTLCYEDKECMTLKNMWCGR